MKFNKKTHITHAAVERLLKKNTLTGLQAGRLFFINACYVMENSKGKSLYTSEENSRIISKIHGEQGAKLIFYTRVATQMNSLINYVLTANWLADQAADYLELILNKHLTGVDPETTENAISNLRVFERRIGGGAVFYDAARIIFKDRRLADNWRIFPSSRRIIKRIKHLDKLINKQDKDYLKQVNIFPVGFNELRNVQRHAAGNRINNLVKYLHSYFDANIITLFTTPEKIENDIEQGNYNK